MGSMAFDVWSFWGRYDVWLRDREGEDIVEGCYGTLLSQ